MAIGSYTITKIGYVTIQKRGESLMLRFTYPKGRRREFTVARDSVAGLLQAKAIARMIDSDINLGIFDFSLERYK